MSLNWSITSRRAWALFKRPSSAPRATWADCGRIGSSEAGCSASRIRKCIQRWRRQGREVPLDDEPGEPALDGHGFAEAPDEVLIREEQESEFMKLVYQLPPLQRSVLLLHVLEDFPLEEIATITSAPLGTVKSRLFHAKKALRQLVAQNA